MVSVALSSQQMAVKCLEEEMWFCNAQGATLWTSSDPGSEKTRHGEKGMELRSV